MRARRLPVVALAIAVVALAAWRVVCVLAGPDVDTDAYAHHMIARAILADPGFGKYHTDHMVSIDYDEGQGWHDAQVIAYGRGRLAAFKCPRSVEFVAELPRTPTGKLLRRQLRAERHPG